MAEYRLYCLDGDGRIGGAAELIIANSDEEALEAALERKAAPCELWQGRRLVAAIPAPSSTT